jgi:hypothetical protein
MSYTVVHFLIRSFRVLCLELTILHRHFILQRVSLAGLHVPNGIPRETIFYFFRKLVQPKDNATSIIICQISFGNLVAMFCFLHLQYLKSLCGNFLSVWYLFCWQWLLIAWTKGNNISVMLSRLFWYQLNCYEFCWT